MFDTHAHLNLEIFKEDYNQIIKNCLDQGISIINVGVNYKTSLRSVEIAEKYQNVYASIGLHPLYLDQEKFDYEQYFRLAKSSKKVIAIGEIGLDYGKKIEEKKQKHLLLRQISLSEELQLPIIFHCRKAHNDLIEILTKKKESREVSGVIHCFTGNTTELKKYIGLGLFFGLNGIIYRMKSKLIKKIPLQKILFETDCPFLTPPHLGDKRNEPQFIVEIIKKVAEIKQIDTGELIKITDKNVKKLFRI